MPTGWLSPRALGQLPLKSPRYRLAAPNREKRSRSDPDAVGSEEKTALAAIVRFSAKAQSKAPPRTSRAVYWTLGKSNCWGWGQ